MGCGGTCGALSAAMAVISMFLVEERAHATEGFKEKCANFCQTFERELGSTKCSVLKEKYTQEDSRCYKTVGNLLQAAGEFSGGRGAYRGRVQGGYSQPGGHYQSQGAWFPA